MNRVRILLLLSVIALIVALVPAASAQDQTFGLTQDEYNALVTANANSSSASSYDYAFNLSLDTTAADSSTNIAIQGSGSMSGGFSLTTDGSIKANGQTTPTPLSIIFVDNTLYISVDGGTTWYSSTGEELAQMATGMGGGMLPVDPSALASGDLSGLESQMGDLGSVATGLENLDPSQFINITAAPDGDTTVYTLSVDIGTLLSTPEMSTVIGTALASSGTMGMGSSTSATPSPQELAMMGQMVGGMFSTATATITQTVDTAAQLVNSTTLNVSIPLGAMSGSTSDGATFVFDITLSNYNAAPAVVAPASSQPLSVLLGGMMGGMGS
ncbi:MAG: hypothetical protein U0452_13205 [Anaerolineae bacterium]